PDGPRRERNRGSSETAQQPQHTRSSTVILFGALCSHNDSTCHSDTDHEPNRIGIDGDIPNVDFGLATPSWREDKNERVRDRNFGGDAHGGRRGPVPHTQPPHQCLSPPVSPMIFYFCFVLLQSVTRNVLTGI